MDLIRKLALVATVAAGIGCHDVTAPPESTNFVLTKVNGVALPAPYSPIPENPVVVGGWLFLNGAGRATITEYRREMSGNVVTSMSTWKYTISGNSIEFDYVQPCPPNALCAAPPSGVFSNSHVLIDFSFRQGLLIYDYQVSALD